MSELADETCEPCEGGVPPMERSEARAYLDRVEDWSFADVPKIRKEYQFKDFNEAMEFVNRMAEVSEAEGHHPNFTVRYNRVDVVVWTHAIDGLSKNDFILAAKLDEAAETVRAATV